MIYYTPRDTWWSLRDRAFNAGVNKALDIARENSVKDKSILYGRCEVSTPIRDGLFS